MLNLFALLACFTARVSAAAQTVFFDDFDGNALLPHWNQPAPSSWAYNVSNSMLNVTGLFSPSHPKSPTNFASMSAPFAAQTDFRMDVWMGWEAGQQPHQLELRVLGPFGANPIIASMGYRNIELFGPPVIYASTGGGQTLTMPAPPPGIYHFTISRMAGQFNFFFGASPFFSSPDNFGTPAANVGFRFVGPYPGELGAFHIDRVQVVPMPGAIGVLVALPLMGTRRRRR